MYFKLILFTAFFCLTSTGFSQTLSVIWPKHNEMSADRTPLFSWNGYDGVLVYQIKLSQDSTFITGNQQYTSTNTSFQLTNDLSSGTWFWQVSASFNGQSLVSNLGKFRVFQPTDIADLKIWYNAESVITNGTSISQLTDLSGNNVHANQNTPSLQPSLLSNVINGKPSIQFFNDQVNTSVFSSTYRTEFLMLRRNGNPNGSYHNVIINSSSPFLQLYLTPDNNLFRSYVAPAIVNHNTFFDLNQFMLITRNVESASINLKKNGLLTSTNSISAIGTLNDYLMIGGYNNGQFFNGELPEYLFYNRVLTAPEQSLVEKFVMDKYAPPVNLGSDRSPVYLNNGSCVNESISVSNIYTSYLWSNGATSQGIVVNQPGIYWVQTTDIYGRVSRDTILVNSPTMDIFNYTEKLVCQIGVTSVTPTIPINHTFLQWSDGVMTNSHNFSFSDLNSSYFMYFSNANGCNIKSNLFKISLDTTLNLVSLGGDTSICSNSLISLTSIPQVPINYLWSTNGANPSQLIQSGGEYWVQVTNSNGCINSDTILIAISGEGPTLHVNIPSSTCIGSLVELSAQGIISFPESITSYTWDFGNSNTSMGDSTSTIYNSTGTKQVQLIVTASNGCEVVLNQTLQVFPNPNININVLGDCIFDVISFTTQNNGYNIQNYFWNLGQNVTSTSAIPNHIYNESGTFPVSVIATDQNGCIDTSNTQLLLTENLSNYSNALTVIWPRNNELLSDRTPLFSWNSIAGISNYQVILSMDSTFSVGVQQFSTSTTTHQLVGNLVSGIWFWKVIASVNGQNFTSNLGKFRIFEPSDISDLKIWYNAENVVTNGANISQVTDLSGNNIHANQNTLSLQPTLVNNGINGKPSIQFINDQLNTSFFSSSYRSEFFMIKRNGNPNGPNHSLIIHPNSPFLQLYVTPDNNLFRSYVLSSVINHNTLFDLNQFMLLSRNVEASQIKLKKNGALTSSNGISEIGTINDNLMIGGFNNSQFFNGEMPEYLFYNRVLTSNEQSLVEKYVMDKYAPPVNLGVDINPIYQNNGSCVNETIMASNLYISYLWSTGATTTSIQVNQPGSYWVQTTDIFGRTSRDTILVNNPKMNIFSDVEFECYNGPTFLTANIPQNHSFIKWNNCNANVTNQIHAGNNYFVEFQNPQGCIIKSNLFSVTIDSSLQNISLGSDTSLCSGNNIQLQNAPTSITDYAWNTGNTQASQIVDTSGIYILEVSNLNNCQNRDTIEVTVVGTSPTLQFAFSDTLCQFSPGSYLDTSFVPNGNGNISSKTWFISNGDTLSGSSGAFSIDTAGTFNVTILVQTQEGCSSATTFPLVVHPKPIISFTTQNHCPYEGIEFTPLNSTLLTLNSFLWNFNQNNNSSTASNPIYSFGQTGTYNVSLQAQDINGCRDTVVQSVYIQPAPVANFSFTNSCEQSAVNFVNESIITDTFNIVTNAWSYGDGTQATNPSFQKVYQAYGAYVVQLVVTANNGCQDTLSQTITIHPKPILGWQVGPACKNTWTSFENQSTIPIGSITQTDWLVNLQYPFEGPSSEFLFVTTGEQYLNLTSTSDQGCSTDTLIIVNVQPEINAAFTVSPTTVVAGVPVVFTNNSIGGTSYEWNLGNDNIIQTTVAEPVEATGFASSFIGDSILTYLAIQNAIGCKDTAYQYVKVNEPRIDLAINQLFVQDINGFYKVGVELRNLGFVEITQTDLLLKLYNSYPILETETESIAPGESRIYLFNANPSSYISTQDNEISYLCVEATSYNDYQLIETELSNNISCLNTEGGNFVLLPIFPNPTNDDITYTLIVSEESTISTFLTDETGRIVQSSTELFASGLHTPTLSMRNLSAGVYYFQISDGVTSKTVKILKN
jgi:PKD repeat protein